MQTIAQNIQTTASTYAPSMENQFSVLANNLVVNRDDVKTFPMHFLRIRAVQSPETGFVTYPSAVISAFSILGLAPTDTIVVDIAKLKEHYDRVVLEGIDRNNTKNMILVMIFAMLSKRLLDVNAIDTSLPFNDYMTDANFVPVLTEFFDLVHLPEGQEVNDQEHFDNHMQAYLTDWYTMDMPAGHFNEVDLYALFEFKEKQAQTCYAQSPMETSAMTLEAPASQAAVEYNRMNNVNAQTAHLDLSSLYHQQQRRPGYFLGGAHNMQPGMGCMGFTELPERIDQLKDQGYLLTDVEQDQQGGLVLYFNAKTMDSVLTQLIPEGFVTGAAPSEDNQSLNLLVTIPGHAFPRGTQLFLEYWRKTKIRKKAIDLLKGLIEGRELALDVILAKKAEKVFGIASPTLEDLEQAPCDKAHYMKFLVDVIAAK